jgi:long-chain acyl-CoA synthetase
MLDIANYAAAKHGDRPFLGTRPVIRIHPAEGALELYELGPYSWLSFVEVRDMMLQAGAGLRQLGLGKPAGAQAAADAPFITMYAETSASWRLVSMGAASISSPFSTAFSTLDPDGVKHTINLPGSIAVFTQADLLPKLVGILKDTPTVKSVIYDGQADGRALQAIRDIGLQPLSVDELLRLGRAYPAPPTPPTAEDLYAVQFTSGTSGLPKGVEVTHQMMVSGVAAIDRLLGDDHYVNAYEQSHCAFLPLAHVIEAMNAANLWYQGVRSGFGRARTLMATGVKNCEGDLAELKPTTIGAVPLVWETIRKAVELQLSSASPVTRGLFNLSYFAKEHNIPLLAQAGDAVVLSKVRAFTGGRLDACLSGGAALSASTNAWFKATGIASIMNGWGLTETTGMGAITHPSTWSAKGDGACLMACVEVKVRRAGETWFPAPLNADHSFPPLQLVDRPESGYRSTDALPSGEILIRGPAVFRRYYKNPEATAQVFDKDGFFTTGDIGRFTAAGALEIVDRVK